MAQVTNISTGPRGAYFQGSLVMAEVGETIEADDYCEEWFEGGDDGEKPLSQMNKAELLATAEAEGVSIEDGATNAAIKQAIEAARAAA